MSCQVKVTASIVDIPTVRRYLFPWDDDRGSDNWLHSCLVSVSPTGEIIAIAHKDRIIVLSAKWDSNAVLSQYHISFSGQLDTTSDNVTAILCLPIASQSQNSQVVPDWTCIMVGFVSGQVRFYTENCMLLLTEQFHEDRVTNIKCQSHQVYGDVSADFRPEEVYIHYPKCVCVLSGVQLFPTLRSSRSQLARVSAKGDHMTPTTHMLLHKKWGLFEQCEVNDIAVVGLDASNTFDHLLTASTCGGFEARYRAMAPNNTLIIGVGSKPYVGFHYAVEGAAQPLFTDVAKAVAVKLKSALPGWLVGSSKTTTEKTTPTIQPPEAIGCRFGLCDLHRSADSIVMSPNKKLSVVIDALGRIVLLDNFKGTAVRMWKGYRGAQCAFLHVPDEERSKHHKAAPKIRRIALFLIVYIPRKGIIEIWALQQGPRIVTFSASKHSRLIYTSYGLLGIENVSSKNKHASSVNCILLDPDGQLKEFVVPFHYALTEKNSKRSRDIHLYKRLKLCLKNDDPNSEKLAAEVAATCSELKTNEIRLQCFEMLASNKYIRPHVISTMPDAFLEHLISSEQPPDSEATRLIILSQNLKRLVEFYMFVEGFYDTDAENGNIANNNNCEAQDQPLKPDTRSVIGEKEMSNLQRLLDLSTMTNEKKAVALKVTFPGENKSVFSEYISVLDLASVDGCISLKKDVPEDKLYRVAEQLFKVFVVSNVSDLSELKEQIIRSTIRTLDLIRLVLCYWVNRPLDINMNLETEMQNLSKLLHLICLTTSSENVCAEYNKISPFWNETRDYLANSAKPFPALTAAVLCRNVALRIEQDKEAQRCSSTSLDDDTTSTDIWEKLSQESCQWTLLIGKLEDISLLNIILSNKPVFENAILPKLLYDQVNISLKYILQKGRGSVSELVAQWLASGGVDPEYIIVNEYCNAPTEPSEEASSRPESVEIYSPANAALLQKNLNVNQPVFEHFNILKKQFPYSLESSAVLANMCWEYALNWHKDMQHLEYLNGMMSCLSLIPSNHIKQGLYHLVWSTHLKQTFEAVCKLVNKVGKVPPRILCKDTGLTDVEIPLFVAFCVQFLDSFMDALQQCYSANKQAPRFENLWENGGSPLTELALQQCDVNYSLLHLHYQLGVVMQIITTFSIKQTKPMQNLFVCLPVCWFFCDLSKHAQVNTYSSEPKMCKARVQFLMKLIKSSIEAIPPVDEEGVAIDHVTWMSKCVSLAGVWGIDADILRRHQVLLLYTNGFNTIAEEILPSISNTEAFGSELLEIAAKQLKFYLMSSKDLTEKVVALSPSLSQYLETLDENWCAPAKLENITMLAEHAVRYLPESNSQLRYASLLLDACLTLRDMED